MSAIARKIVVVHSCKLIKSIGVVVGILRGGEMLWYAPVEVVL